MSDLALPQSIIDRIDELDRRLRDVERNARLPFSSMQGGQLRVLDDDGSPVVIIGEQEDGTVGTHIFDSDGDLVAVFGQLDAGARNGVEVYNGANTRVQRADERGAIDPPVYLPTVGFVSGFIDVTAGAFNAVWESRVEKMKNPYFRVRVQVGVDGATTGEMRWVFDQPGVGVFQASPLRALSAGSLGYHYLDMAVDIGPLPLNSSFDVWLEVRRLTGAGTIHVYQPVVSMGDYSATANTTGVWS